MVLVWFVAFEPVVFGIICCVCVCVSMCVSPSFRSKLLDLSRMALLLFRATYASLHTVIQIIKKYCRKM